MTRLCDRSGSQCPIKSKKNRLNYTRVTHYDTRLPAPKNKDARCDALTDKGVTVLACQVGTETATIQRSHYKKHMTSKPNSEVEI